MEEPVRNFYSATKCCNHLQFVGGLPTPTEATYIVALLSVCVLNILKISLSIPLFILPNRSRSWSTILQTPLPTRTVKAKCGSDGVLSNGWATTVKAKKRADTKDEATMTATRKKKANVSNFNLYFLQTSPCGVCHTRVRGRIRALTIGTDVGRTGTESLLQLNVHRTQNDRLVANFVSLGFR